jgi:hypothetical protein
LIKDLNKKFNIREAVDKHLVREVVLFAQNDGGFYRSKMSPIIKNLTRKIKSGKFDEKLALKDSFVDSVAKTAIELYGKQLGDLGRVDKQTRLEIGRELVKDAIVTAKEDLGIYEDNNEMTEKENAELNEFRSASSEPNSATGRRLGIEYPKHVDVLFDKTHIAGEVNDSYRLFMQFPSGKVEFFPENGQPGAKTIEELAILSEVLPEEYQQSVSTALLNVKDVPAERSEHSGEKVAFGEEAE